MGERHQAATHHVPAFITAPGETDVLMVITGVILVLAVLMFGIVFFRLHTLPERMAHKSKRIQFEIVAVLGLLALFTHMHIFWVIGLLLALIDLPDFGSSLNRIAGSAEKMAGISPGQGAAEAPFATTGEPKHEPQPAEAAAGTIVRQGDAAAVAASKADIAPGKKMEVAHA